MFIHRAFFAPLLTFALILSVNMAAAFDLSAKPIGSITQWRTHNGNTSVEVLARDGKLFKLAFSRDNSKGQPNFAIWWARKDGQLVESTNASGEWTRFKPHDCELTLGKCRYSERRSDGRKRKMIRVSSQAEGKISYALYRTKVSRDTLVEKGTFSVDQYGYVIDRDYISKDGTQMWTRRIRSAEPAS